MLQKIIKSFIIILAGCQLSSAKLCTVSSKEKYTRSDIYNSPEAADFKEQLNFMADQSLAYWYTDRDSDMQGAKNNLQSFVDKCGSEVPVIVVYGLPNKDCDGKESSSGFNTDSSSYEQFIKNLKQTLTKKAIIILEPDAVATTIEGAKCGESSGYTNNLKNAINILGDSNLETYIDVGHWVLIYGDDKIKKLTDYISSIDSGKLKGFSLNLSNYRKTEEMEKACRDIRKVSGKDYRCIIDTSRNNNGHSSKDTWCNYKGAGIGISGNDPSLDSLKSKDSGIEHYIWIKPAIELDGSCQGNPDSYSSNKGAGEMDIGWLKNLWNNGYYSGKKLNTNSNNIEQPSSTTIAPSTSVTPYVTQQQNSQSPVESNSVVNVESKKTEKSFQWKICKAKK